MATDVLKPSRRGFLGIFAAASATALVAAPIAAPAAPVDWRMKPVAEWTQADFVAEAEFELAAHTKKVKEVFRVGMSVHEEQLYRAHQMMMRWWEIELMERRGDFL